MGNGKLPLRNEIDKSLKWKIEDIYATDDAWKSDYEKIKSLLPDILKFKGKVTSSAENLLSVLKLNDEISKLFSSVYVYANMKWHEDTSNSFYQGLADQSSSLMVQVNSAASFIVPEILGSDKIEEFLETNKELDFYKIYLNNLLRLKAHILSPEIEEILAQSGEIMDSPDNIFAMLNNADITFDDIPNERGEMVELTKGRYTSYLESQDRKVREAAFKSLYKSYIKQKNTLTAIFNANVKKDAFIAKVRKYNSSLEAALDDSNIPVEVYHNLIKAVENKLPLMHKYVNLRKKLLGVDELHMYDLYVPMVKDVEMNISFEQAKEKVLEGLAPMGEEYLSLLKKGFNEGWIDVCENQRKRSGAYSWGTYGVHPYVLLNHQDNLDSTFTLAHEMGHAIHSYYSDTNQPYIYASYKIFVAEVASTVNESLLMQHMINTAKDKTQKAYLINHFLEKFRGTLFRQTMFAEFEMITHKMVEDGEALTADVLCDIYHKLNKKYFGNDITIDSEIDMEWARIPHFYSAFYVYQYSTGFSAAIALSQKILEQGQKAVEPYVSFLKSGGSDYPINLLKIAGVDMTTAEPIDKALDLFDKLLNELEELML